MEETYNDGKFKKGHPGYKKIGSLNNVTRKMRERVEKVLAILEETLEDDLETLSPKEKVQLWVSLQQFVRPKFKRIQMDTTTKGKEINKITFVVKNGSQSKVLEKEM